MQVMKDVIDFLVKLGGNNNREWFEANKKEYKAAKAGFEDFVEQLIGGISSFDDSVRGLAAKDCVYRIYRDVRFSRNKDPYKTHMGAFVSPGGRNGGNAGYYFHVEPAAGGMIGGSILSAGIYMPDAAALKSIREDLLYNGQEFLAAVAKADGFGLEMRGSLKRVPAGFPAESPMAEYLKMKEDVSVYRHVGEGFLLAPGLLERTVAEFEKTYGLVNWLNRAVRYAREESGK